MVDDVDGCTIDYWFGRDLDYPHTVDDVRLKREIALVFDTPSAIESIRHAPLESPFCHIDSMDRKEKGFPCQVKDTEHHV